MAHARTHLFDTGANKSNIQRRRAAITSTLGRLLSGTLVNVLYLARAVFARTYQIAMWTQWQRIGEPEQKTDAKEKAPFSSERKEKKLRISLRYRYQLKWGSIFRICSFIDASKTHRSRCLWSECKDGRSNWPILANPVSQLPDRCERWVVKFRVTYMLWCPYRQLWRNGPASINWESVLKCINEK